MTLSLGQSSAGEIRSCRISVNSERRAECSRNGFGPSDKGMEMKGKLTEL